MNTNNQTLRDAFLKRVAEMYDADGTIDVDYTLSFMKQLEGMHCINDTDIPLQHICAHDIEFQYRYPRKYEFKRIWIHEGEVIGSIEPFLKTYDWRPANGEHILAYSRQIGDHKISSREHLVSYSGKRKWSISIRPGEDWKDELYLRVSLTSPQFRTFDPHPNGGEWMLAVRKLD